ncbi:MAG: RNA methyltransferase [Sporocytophaga sp.]|uniref:TrmH family RNA methyltransferase n=1 Tax=Sporocytophaga sp. TaxID=2231183 RepID=UPI001B120DCB|nr:RNA methyltransferase [Sporocytophaga sp.]MBO9700490.1 RNA methyltransferase [Sporocytophaga sp.]
MEEVLETRTRFLTVVVEDIFQPHNASAVVRTCDCFGIQDIHVIENKNKYKVSEDVTLGSAQWVDIIKHNTKGVDNTLGCYRKLKEKGYKIIATTPHTNDIALEDFQLDTKTALVFGSEQNGISEIAKEHADGFIKIPMVGFTESLNISVCAAICIHQLTLRMRELPPEVWQLSQEEKEILYLKWIKGVVRKSDLLEKEFYKRCK